MTEPAAPTGPGAFAVRLRRLREAAALSQEELAARAGLTARRSARSSAVNDGGRTRTRSARSPTPCGLDDDEREALTAASAAGDGVGRPSHRGSPPAHHPA